MNLSSLVMTVTKSVGRQLLILQKESPHIFFVGGLIGTATSTYLACRATLKLSDTLDEIQKDVDEVKGLKVDVKNGENGRYPAEQYEKDIIYVYARSSFKVVKLYAPSIIIGVASVGALTGSHVQLTRRNSALMAAYAAVSKAYEDYRERVREELGEKKELDIYHAAKTETVEEDGKNKQVKKADPNRWSPYARFFDEVSKHWEKDPELNRLYVQCQQNFANNLLQARGHVFLNEVYDMLDIDRSSAGAVVGWVIGQDGDNYIDFGLYEAYNANFINGRERSILLDFNVDGVIYDKI